VKQLVVDASAMLAILFDEAEAPLVRRIVADATEQEFALNVPTNFWLEVGNALVAGRVDTAKVFAAIRELDEYGLVTADVDRPLLLLAIDVALGDRLSVYDAAYLALARQLGADLLTLDRELAAAAGEIAVVPSYEPPRLLSEDRAPYGTATSGPLPDYSEMSAFLAKLRADAEDELGRSRARSEGSARGRPLGR